MISEQEEFIFKAFVKQRDGNYYQRKTKAGNPYYSTYKNASNFRCEGKVVKYKLVLVEEEVVNEPK